jgi:asparagine synthetase B (glutamine-hydrolysing)
VSEALVAAFGAAAQARIAGPGDAPPEPDGPLVASAPRVARTERTLCLLHGSVATSAELAAELGLAAEMDAAELVALGFERWGEAVFGRCIGTWTMLLWDRRRHEGVAARDHVGQHSLYVTSAGGGLALASELGAMIELLPATPSPDELAMAGWLARTGPPAGRTLLTGVHRVAPGHLVRFDARGAAEPERPFWEPRARRGPARSFDEAISVLRDELSAAAARALGGARQPALMLSGGLDSSIVAALIADRGPRCYSGAFPGRPEMDETAVVEATRRHLGLEGESIAFAGGSAVAPALRFQERTRIPSVTGNLFVWEPLMQRVRADGVDVLLDGEGGDEMLGVSTYLIADRLRRARLMSAVALARRVPGVGEHPPLRWVRRALAQFGVRGAMPGPLHRALIRARRTPQPADRLLRPDLAAAIAASYDAWGFKARGGPLWAASLIDSITVEADALGVNDQLRGEAALHGVPQGHPLRDPRLLEAALSFDPEWSFDPVLDRPIARAALDSQLAPEVREPARKPRFNELLDDALNGPDRRYLREYLADPHARVRELVRSDALAGLVERPVSGVATLEAWRLLTLETWLRSLENGRPA